MSTASESLAAYYMNLRSEHLAQDVLAKAKEVVLDFLGCALGGAGLPSSRIVNECLGSLSAPDGCTVILGGKAPVDRAAFINAVYAHGLEMDDVNYTAGGHPAVVIIPAAMAVAQRQGSSGPAFLLAVISGYDLMCRVGRAANPDSQFKRGLHPTSINGTFGAAIAGAKLMNLDPGKAANALGIAGSFTSGNLECYADGSLTKRINPGVGAQGGVMAALLAAGGYTGPRWIFEGRSGFLVSYSDAPDSSLLTEDLDYRQFGIMKTGFKPYANCRYNHSSISAALELRNRHGIDYRDIEQVTVKVVSMAVRGVCEPSEVKYNPQNIVDAQFSLPYSVSVALIKGRAFIEEYTMDMLFDSEVRNLMPRIKMEHSPELDRMLPDAFPSEVIIRLKNGVEYYQRVDYCKGDPQNPLTPKELADKFTGLARLGLSDENRMAMIRDVVSRLDTVPDISELTSLL